MSHIPQLPGQQRLHPAETEPLTVWLPTPLKAYVLVLAQQQHVSPSTLVERLIVAEQTRVLQAATAAEPQTSAPASSIRGSTALCAPGTGPVADATPPPGAASSGAGILRLAPSELRQHIVAALQNRLEGLTPPQVQALIGTDTDLRALMRRMFREGIITRPAKGVYAVKTPGAPCSRPDPKEQR